MSLPVGALNFLDKRMILKFMLLQCLQFFKLRRKNKTKHDRKKGRKTKSTEVRTDEPGPGTHPGLGMSI